MPSTDVPVQGQQLLPKVKLGSGLPQRRQSSRKGAGRRGVPPKLRLKAPEPDQAISPREKQHSAQQRGAQPRLSVGLGGAQKQSPPAQRSDALQKSYSFRVKLRVNSREDSIPQVDGPADFWDDEPAMGDMEVDEAKYMPATHDACMRQTDPLTMAVLAAAHAGAAQAGLEPEIRSTKPAQGLPGAQMQTNTKDHTPRPDQPQQLHGSGVDAEAGPGHASDLAHASVSGLETPVPSAEEHVSEGAAVAAPAAKQVSNPEPVQEHAEPSSLTADELAALPLVVRALREWLDAQTSRISGIGDPDGAQVRIPAFITQLNVLRQTSPARSCCELWDPPQCAVCSLCLEGRPEMQQSHLKALSLLPAGLLADWIA